jgi:hypothetical protein
MAGAFPSPIVNEIVLGEPQPCKLGFPVVPVLASVEQVGALVHVFCSEKCRTDFLSDEEYMETTNGTLIPGESDSYLNGTRCDLCGKSVQLPL